MLGWKLFVRALRLLIDNLGEALRVSAVPYAVVLAVGVWLSTQGAGPEIAAPDASVPAVPPMASGGMVLLGLVNVAASLWIAVAWHRHVLLEERATGWVPPLHGREMLGYMGRSILIGLLVALVVLVVAIPLGTLTMILSPGAAAAVIGAGGLFVAMILFYRLAIVLPAGAIGQPLKIGEAWEATRGHSGTAVVLALLTVGFSYLLQIPTVLDGGGGGVVSAVYQGVVGWIGLMLGVSTLTALYGYLIEGRAVD